MKCFIVFILILLISVSAFAQNDWVRVQSNNGEFSIEIPKSFNYFFSDKEIASGNDTRLNQMHLITGFSEDSLVSVESYHEGKSLLNEYLEIDKVNIRNEKIVVSKFDRDGLEIRQLEKSNVDFYMVRQYINLNNAVYILTTASRQGKTATMQKFLDSAIFKKDSPAPIGSVQLISKLPKTKIEVITNGVKPLDNAELPKNQNKSDKSVMLILTRPRARFTDSGRGTSGTIYLRVSCLETGFINRIEVVAGLPYGLTWQAISSVIGSKILPAEINGKPTSSQKIITYTFTTY